MSAGKLSGSSRVQEGEAMIMQEGGESGEDGGSSDG